jgi:hypothetical protein
VHRATIAEYGNPPERDILGVVKRTARITLPALAVGLAMTVLAPLSDARPAATPPCTGSQLSGTFKAIPGSPGAGNIVYRLRVRNSSSAACGVTGLPVLTLLNARGRKLPTRTTFSGMPGTLTAILVTLRPGSWATLTARFSPDVPGQGEPVTNGACEPIAYKLRVAPSGGGSVIVPITPATPVCEHGSLQVTTFRQA